MQIGVITFCDAVNYGAYLQAFSLGEYLKKSGHEVSYIRTASLKSLYWEMHNLYAYHLNRIKFRNEFRHKWMKAKKKLNITRKRKGYDLIIIGSDEMWQLNGATVKPLPIFWGIGADAKKIITYAVCSNGTKTEDTKKYSFISSGVRNLAAISVRDKKTKSVFQPLTDKKIQIHVDPTFLVNLREYSVKPDLTDYILVYTYSFDESKISSVKSYTQQHNKKVVCVGNKFDWCDICIPASPFETLGLFENADYVITDTFHGTVLATHFNKPFASYAVGKEKVKQFLDEFGLSMRCVTQENTLDNVLNSYLDYSEFNNKLGIRKKESFSYLDSFITEGRK